MVRSGTTSALFGALIIAAPAQPLHAQSATGLILKPSAELADEAKPVAGPRLPPRKRQKQYEQVPELFGIPLTQQGRAREKGLVFGARPDKGLRPTAKLRF